MKLNDTKSAIGAAFLFFATIDALNTEHGSLPPAPVILEERHNHRYGVRDAELELGERHNHRYGVRDDETSVLKDRHNHRYGVRDDEANLLEDRHSHRYGVRDETSVLEDRHNHRYGVRSLHTSDLQEDILKRRHNHRYGVRHAHATANLSPRDVSQSSILSKRGEKTCAFPTGVGLVAVNPGGQNAGWAMSPDEPCTAGKYCPYACPPGELMAQWDPDAMSYSYPQSMNGGLYCNEKGEVEKPFPNKPYCYPGTGSIAAVNKCGGSVAFCQTVLPGNEAMLISTSVSSSAILAVPGTEYWAETAAHYYINPPGVSTADGCIWGDGSKPVGNWSPYVAGANTDGNGNTFVKVAWNPIYTGESTFANDKPTFGVRITCDGGGCNGLPCSIDPSKHEVNGVESGNSATGAGGGNFCVVTVSKGSQAKIETFDVGGSSSGGFKDEEKEEKKEEKVEEPKKEEPKKEEPKKEEPKKEEPEKEEPEKKEPEPKPEPTPTPTPAPKPTPEPTPTPTPEPSTSEAIEETTSEETSTTEQPTSSKEKVSTTLTTSKVYQSAAPHMLAEIDSNFTDSSELKEKFAKAAMEDDKVKSNGTTTVHSASVSSASATHKEEKLSQTVAALVAESSTGAASGLNVQSGLSITVAAVFGALGFLL